MAKDGKLDLCIKTVERSVWRRTVKKKEIWTQGFQNGVFLKRCIWSCRWLSGTVEAVDVGVKDKQLVLPEDRSFDVRHLLHHALQVKVESNDIPFRQGL